MLRYARLKQYYIYIYNVKFENIVSLEVPTKINIIE